MRLENLNSVIDCLDLKVDFDRVFVLRQKLRHLYPNDIENLLALSHLVRRHKHLGSFSGAIEILNNSLGLGLDVRGDIMCVERIAELYMEAGEPQSALALTWSNNWPGPGWGTAFSTNSMT
jgi:hypothetical protein